MCTQNFSPSFGSVFSFHFSWFLSCVQHGGSSWQHCGGSPHSFGCKRATVALTDKHRHRDGKSSHLPLPHSYSLRGSKHLKKKTTLLHPSVQWQNDYSCKHDSPSHSLSSFPHSLLAAGCWLLTADTVGAAEEIASREYLLETTIASLSHCSWSQHETFTQGLSKAPTLRLNR